ncbi:hypothetical protein LNP18_06295 [Leuconostoc citreum]|uniref:hypothetical protein n=1 Tax=Leuconostoc citreum TaxID=33964 RepID=UPI00200AB825|nr:hypothetical protein [Leuconostoc citreum]MCK8605713.1 hypothetical protein [Leuconostoc citreum]
MVGQYDVYLAVDFFNTRILFTAKTSGELSRKILTGIEKGTLTSDGAVRMYRTTQVTLDDILAIMSMYHVPFHEAAKPLERPHAQ